MCLYCVWGAVDYVFLVCQRIMSGGKWEESWGVMWFAPRSDAGPIAPTSRHRTTGQASVTHARDTRVGRARAGRREGDDVPFAHRIGASRRQTKKVGGARVWDKVESRRARRGVSARRMRSFRGESKGGGGVGVARQEGGRW